MYYAWNMAFLPDYAQFYPSGFLWSHMVRECHDKGLKEFNMMRGEAEYKTKWTKSARANAKFTIRRSNHVYGKWVSLLERPRAAEMPIPDARESADADT